MSPHISRRFTVFVLLALTMAATRFDHVGNAWIPPDASWAVFFVGGFYLSRAWRWVLPVLLLEAVAVNFAAIRYYGVSNYCVTLAYWFILPAYSTLWVGGAWLRNEYRHVPSDVPRLLVSLAVSVTACFLFTQGSFYWLGGQVKDPSLAGWWSNFSSWYGHFLSVSGVYVALAALLQIALAPRPHGGAVLEPHGTRAA